MSSSLIRQGKVMSEHHQHQHVVMAVGRGANIDEAIFNAVAGVSDPQGHHPGLKFESFRVEEIEGTISYKPGDHGTPTYVQVTIQAIGAHVK